jgi:glycerol uptake facilitator protein
MEPYIAEIIGSALLIVLGNGVVANVILNKTKGQQGGWIVITFGWAIGVFVGVFAATKIGGSAHLNPAITIAFAAAGKFEWASVPGFIGAQIVGSILGSLLVWLSYHDHYKATDDANTKLATFATIPAIRNPLYNFITETIGTFVLVFAVFFLAAPSSSLGALDALPVALLVLGLGLSLGGPTGYAINPSRDLGPRILHAILPIRNKGGSDWSYAWVPIAGPIVGGLLAALLFMNL